MNNNTGPDILGICEIENRPVVEKLVRFCGIKMSSRWKPIFNDLSI